MGAARLAFYDLDGTLVSSNVVDQYLWYAKRASLWRVARALLRAPGWLMAERKSRLLFNRKFFREYAGLSEQFLLSNAATMANEVLQPALYTGAKARLDEDRAAGFQLILVTGSLDFAIDAFAKALGFTEVLANRLRFENGIAQGELAPPVLAERAKVDAMMAACSRHNADPQQCRAYSDSLSDVPMLEAVGEPIATNPNAALRAIAESRNWPILNLK